jgi:hypothetical protein
MTRGRGLTSVRGDRGENYENAKNISRKKYIFGAKLLWKKAPQKNLRKKPNPGRIKM